MKPAEYLDAAKTALALKTDYELAKSVGITTAEVSQTKHEKRLMPQPLIEAVAKALKLEFGYVYLDLKRQRKSRANTLKVLTTAPKGAPAQEKDKQGIGIMSNLRKLFMQIEYLARSTFSDDQKHYDFAGL